MISNTFHKTIKKYQEIIQLQYFLDFISRGKFWYILRWTWFFFQYSDSRLFQFKFKLIFPNKVTISEADFVMAINFWKPDADDEPCFEFRLFPLRTMQPCLHFLTWITNDVVQYVTEKIICIIFMGKWLYNIQEYLFFTIRTHWILSSLLGWTCYKF